MSKKLNKDLSKKKHYGGKFKVYDYSLDKDFSGLDTTEHELLDKVPRKTIEQQVKLFEEAGVRLDESRRLMMTAGYAGDDSDIPDDIDELETILDKPDVFPQDYDEAIAYLKDKKKQIDIETKKAVKAKKAQPLDNSSQNPDNSKQQVQES